MVSFLYLLTQGCSSARNEFVLVAAFLSRCVISEQEGGENRAVPESDSAHRKRFTHLIKIKKEEVQ